MSVAAVGNDDVGHDDCEGNVLHLAAYQDMDTGDLRKDLYVTVPADTFRDKKTLEWIYSQKDPDSKTDDLYNDLIAGSHSVDAAKRLTGMRAMAVTQTGFDQKDKALLIESMPEAADEHLTAMSEKYGQENLEAMKPADFYRLYKEYSFSRQ